MNPILRTLLSLWALAAASAAHAEPSSLLNFGNGVTASFNFLRGPAVAEDGHFESTARVIVDCDARGARRVRSVAFDAVMHMGRVSHALTDNRVPKVTAVDAAAWELSNIFFTMEKKWEGKLTLYFDDGTEQTEWFPIEVRRR